MSHYTLRKARKVVEDAVNKWLHDHPPEVLRGDVTALLSAHLEAITLAAAGFQRDAFDPHMYVEGGSPLLKQVQDAVAAVLPDVIEKIGVPALRPRDIAQLRKDAHKRLMDRAFDRLGTEAARMADEEVRKILRKIHLRDE